MSELHKFLFDGLPVRGMLVRLTDSWGEILRRRAANSDTGAYPTPVRTLLGEMTAAAVLMQANLKFDGSLVLQIMGDGPLKLAVAEVGPALGLRATASVKGEVAPGATLTELVNQGGNGRCAITLEPKARLPGQQPYQGVVPLLQGQQDFSAILQHYMRQSEQLDTALVLAANDQVAAGLLIQRMPRQGEANLAGPLAAPPGSEQADEYEDYQRIAMLAASLTRDELLTLPVDTILHRLFWQEQLLRFAPSAEQLPPHFACNCSRQRVGKMIRGLGPEEAAAIVAERGKLEVGCEFCGKQYRFDSVDVAQLFAAPEQPPESPAPDALH